MENIMKCPKCNYENSQEALYCGLCYHVLRKEEIPLEVIHYEAEKDFDVISIQDETKPKLRSIYILISIIFISIILFLIISK